MPVDKKTIVWFKGRLNRRFKISKVAADKDARYEKVLEFDAGLIKPMVSIPHSVDNVVFASTLKNVLINEAFLGTCTNGRLEDFKIAAKILKGRKVNPRVRMIIAPSSRQVYLDAIKLGLVKVFIQAGCAIVSPGCGPCVGTHNGVPSDGEIVISTANRNFKGRMGNPAAFIYLASPATVAASAIKGHICDPRIFL